MLYHNAVQHEEIFKFCGFFFELLFVVLNFKLIAYIEVLMIIIIVEIDNAKPTILYRNFERIQQMPTGTPEVIRESVKHQPIAHPVKLVIPIANAIIIPYEQILMLLTTNLPNDQKTSTLLHFCTFDIKVFQKAT